MDYVPKDNNGHPRSSFVTCCEMNSSTLAEAWYPVSLTDRVATAEQLRVALAVFRRDARLGSLNTGRYRMRYFVWGAGPPLVFVHGMADAARSFVMVMHRLIERFTCIGYELPDGKSDGSHLCRYHLTDYTTDLVALLDHLGLDRVAVLGSSFGSLVVLQALATVPQRFTHAVLENGFARRPLASFQRVLVHIGRFWPGWFGDWPALFRQVMQRVEPVAMTRTPAEVADFLVECGGRTPLCTSALRSIVIDRTDLRPLLPKITTPVLLLTSNCDRLVPRSCWDELVAGLPIVRQVELPGCGHYPHFSHPGPMAEQIMQFLCERSSVTASDH